MRLRNVKMKVDKNKFLFNLLAEQNNDLLEEVINMKKAMIEFFGQLIDDFEDGMNDMKNEARKHTRETAVALKNIQKQIKNAISGSKLHDTKRKKPAAKTSSGTSLPPQPSGTGTKEQKGSGVGKAFKTKSATNPPPRPAHFRKKKSSYLQKTKVRFIGDSVSHNANFAYIEQETNYRIRTKKAYSSVRDNDARWPNKNLADIAPKALIDTHEEDEYSHLIIAAPTVDISNLDVTKLTPRDNVEVYKQKVIKSCENVFNWKKNFYFF